MNVTLQANLAAKRAFVNATASGQTQVVAAQPGLRIRALAVSCVAGGAVSVKFQSASTDISATHPVAANGGFVMPEILSGWFQTNPGEPLNLNIDQSVAVGVCVVWMAVA